MQIMVQGLDYISSNAVRDFARRHVNSKFGRIGRNIRSIRVWVRDVNGPRGGRDHFIQLLIRLKPTGRVMIQHRDFDAYAGVAVAVDRARRAVKRALTRRRTSKIDARRLSRMA